MKCESGAEQRAVLTMSVKIKTAVPQKQFSVDFFVVFTSPEVAHAWSFLAISPPFLSRFQTYILYAVGRAGWMKSFSRTRIFFGVGVPRLGLLISVETAKRHIFSVYTVHFPSLLPVCIIFPLCVVLRILEVFGCGSSVVRNFRNFSDKQSSLPTHLCITHRDHADTLHMTEVMVHSVL